MGISIQDIEGRLEKLADKLSECEDEKTLARHAMELRVLNLLLSIKLKLPPTEAPGGEHGHLEHPSARRARAKRPVA